MAGTHAAGRGRLGAVLLAALLVLSVLGGVAGTGTAHEKGNHVKRNGGTLQVVLGDQHGVKKAKQITVKVEGGKTLTWPSKKKKNATGEFHVPVGKLSERGTNLKNVNVTVTAKNKTLFTERENLRMLTFGNGKKASFRDDGRLYVPLKRALGYADGASVTVKLDGEKKPVRGEVLYVQNDTYLAVSFKPNRLTLPLSKQATIEVPGRGETKAPLQRLVREATSVARVNGETVVVTNPLLTKNTEYVLDVHTGSGRYTSLAKTNGTGALTVTDPALADATRLTVTVSRNRNVLIDGYQPPPAEETPVKGVVSDDGTRVRLVNASLSAQNVTVWLTNESEYVRVSVPVANESVIDLGSTDYRLAPNGTYRLLVEDGGTFLRVTVAGNETGATMHAAAPLATSNATNGTTTAMNESAPSGGLPGPGGLDAKFFVGALLVLVVGVLAIIRFTGGGGSGADGSAGGSGTTRYKVDVFVEDGRTNNWFDGEATVTARKKDTSGAEKRTTTTNGKATFNLTRGTWSVTVESNGVSETGDVDVDGNESPTFTLGPKTVEPSVSDDGGNPLPNARVTCTTDAGQSATSTPDQLGQADVEVPLDASEVTVSADHEKYEASETTVTFDGTTTVRPSLTLRRLTGDLRVTATVDGTAVPGVRVGVTPREDAIRNLGEDGRTATTGSNGVVTFDELVEGEYEVGVELPAGGESFSLPSERVRIRDGQVARASLDATFEYSLDRSDRDRIDAIRRDAESLADASGRDVAIPYYYGTVVTDLLDAVERVGTEGHRFATVHAEPDEVVAELLDAAEEIVRVVDNAMSTKRNIDLFGACVDLPDDRVEWSGEFDPDDLFELLDEDRTTQRQTVLERLRRVDDRIDDERSGLAEVAPAREPWERVQEFVNSERGENLVRGAAVAFVAGGALDAVDELFDHEQLRERLERTVF